MGPLRVSSRLLRRKAKICENPSKAPAKLNIIPAELVLYTL